MVDSKENYKFDVGVKVLGYKHLSWYSTFENSIIYLQYDCLLSMHVFVCEAIHHTEHNIYFNNQHVCY